MNKEFQYTQNIVNLNTHTKKHISVDVQKSLLGFLIFVGIFLITIPYILFRHSYYSILEAYLPNVDLIANILTWHGGPYELWAHLYPPSPLTLFGFTSQTLINYMALLGLTYIVARETARTDSVKKGWSLAFVMLLLTYLLPGQFVSWIMDKTYNFIKKTTDISTIDIDSIVVSIGSLLTITIILGEVFILHTYRKNLEHIAKNILKFPKLMKK